MTPHMAAVENKRLKANSGWRFVPVHGKPQLSALVGAAAGIDVHAGRQQRHVGKPETTGTTPPATPAASSKKSARASTTPAVPAATSSALPPSTPATGRKGSKRKASGEFQPTGDPEIDNKHRQLAELQAQIDALKNKEASILGTPLPAAPPAEAAAAAAAPPSTPAAKKAKTAAPTPVSIPTTPAMSRQVSQATPGATPATPLGGTSRAGRSVKAPQHYADMELSAEGAASRPRQLQGQLKGCRKLLDHLAAHKGSAGIFSVPVNYSDPSKMYYAPNYLATIGSSNRPMDLGTVRNKLTAFEYPSMHEFAADVRMVYRNAMLYNPETEWIHKAAADCMRIFEREIKRIEELPERGGRHTDDDEEAYRRERNAKKSSRRNRELQQMRSQLPVNGAAMDLFEQMTARILALEAKLQQSTPMPMLQEAAYSPPMKPQPAPSTPSYREPAYRPEPVPRAPAARKSSTPAPKHLHPLSQFEKQALKDDIFKLPSHKLGPVVEIISKAMPKTEQKDDADEIEIDIDKLDIPTLRELQTYVKKALGQAAPKRSKPQTPAQRRQTPGGAGPGPKGSPGTGVRATPSVASPLPVPSAAAMASPSRLDVMPSTPNLGRASSQAPGAALGNTTPALKYDSSSDDDSSDSSDDDDDLPAARPQAAAAAAAMDEAPAPILDAQV